MISRRGKRIALGFTFTTAVVLVIFASVESYFINQERLLRLEQDKALIKPQPKNVHTVVRDSRTRTRTYATRLDPWMEANVPAEAAGRVTAVHVEPGQPVQADEVLVELDPETAAINLRAAEANFKEANRLYQQAKALLAEEVVSRTEFEAANSRLLVAQAERDAAQRVLDQHTIRAPFAGVINERLVDLGDAIRVNEPVVRLVDLDKLRVVFYVNDVDIHNVREGAEVDLSITGLPGKTFHPTIAHISRAADEATRLFRVEAVLADPQAQLPGGVHGKVTLKLQDWTDTVFVPVTAVRLSGDEATVLRLQGEAGAEAVAIEIGPEVDGFYPVLSGLKDGDQVIIR